MQYLYYFHFKCFLSEHRSVLVCPDYAEVQELIDNTVYPGGSSIYRNILFRAAFKFLRT